MVRTVAELLEQLRVREAEILAGQGLAHAPTIGAMYEGLTQDLLGRAIPPSLGLTVASGFIHDSRGRMSKQLDCMVMCGEGDPIPHTSSRLTTVDNVVAVVEVKKNLYSGDLRSGYENLASIRPLEAEAVGRSVDLLKDAFQSITRRAFPEREGELESYSQEIQLIYHTLRVELAYPLRVVFGYDGFASENSLRQSFADYLDDVSSAGPARGFGPARLPSLICCGQYVLLKANGMPFHAPLLSDGYWPIYSSSTCNPLEMVLECLWTRLVYEGRLPGAVFAGSSVQQTVNRFLDTRPERVGENWGWRYRYVGELPKDAGMVREAPPWEPAFVDETQFIAIGEMGHKGQIDLADADFVRFLQERGYTPDALTESLNRIGLAARIGDRLILLTRECACAILPDGRLAAGENTAGQFSRWVEEHVRDEPG